MRLIAALLTLVLAAGCASTVVDLTDEATVQRYDAFKSGNVVLPMGTLEAAEWTLNRHNAYNLLAAGRWRELADLVQRKGINNDLNWYYLGRAAEGLGYFEAAKVYYQTSIERSQSDKYSHRCEGKVMSMCDGFDFPDVAQTRLAALSLGGPMVPATPNVGGPLQLAPDSDDLLRTGTGFVVDAKGAVVTNFHVVQGCGTVSFLVLGSGSAKARIIASDPVNDLALIRAETAPAQAAVFQEPERLRAGDDVIVFGYPLVGQLASAGNVSRGSVTALSGLRDDTRFFQISAPIQLGNSGGPVLDMTGRVAGVVTYKLNAARELKVTGDIAQNVNFALKAAVLRAFLDSNGVAYARAEAGAAQTAADVGTQASQFTGIVGCYRS